MPEPASIEFHPFLADRFAEALFPAASVLVVDHDARPLERLVGMLERSDAKWLDGGRARAALAAAAAAVKKLPAGETPDDLISTHELQFDPHTKRDAVMDPPDWAKALNELTAALCVATRKTPGWNGQVLAKTADGETLEAFVEAARILTPEGHNWYGKLAGGMVAWMQGGPVRGFLTRQEVPLLRKALDADARQMFIWKDRGGDFHRRKVQAFCFLAEKHGVGLAAVVR